MRRFLLQLLIVAAAAAVLAVAQRAGGWAVIVWAAGCLTAYLTYEAWAVSRLRRSGDDEHGTLFWAESVRWLGVRWGLLGWTAGLRAAGYRGRIIPVDWHSRWRGTWLLPALRARRLMNRHAERIAERAVECRRRNPAAPIALVGYSCGAYVVLEAARRLPVDVQVDQIVLIGAAVSPGYDLSQAASRVKHSILNIYSALDWPLSGVGLLLLGTADGRHRPSAGVVGFRGVHNDKVRQESWRPRFVRWLYLGDHFTVGSALFARDYVAERLVSTSAI
jgi:hypothetical protein